MYTFAEVRIQGHVGKDPVVQGSVMKFNVAKSDSWTDRDTGERRERTKWNTITVFDRNPGFQWLRDNLRKGDPGLHRGRSRKQLIRTKRRNHLLGLHHRRQSRYRPHWTQPDLKQIGAALPPLIKPRTAENPHACNLKLVCKKQVK